MGDANTMTQSKFNPLRTHGRLQRSSLSAIQQKKHAHAALEHFRQHIDLSKIQKIGVFLAQDGELETQALIAYLWQNQQNVYLPVLETRPDWHMGFAHYTAHSHLILNQFKIAEPAVPFAEHIGGDALDLVLMPLVGFDEQGNRLGMGGGFYDRTFDFKRQQPQAKPQLIGWAHECQKVSALPTEPWDVPLDGLITEEKIRVFKQLT